MATKIALGNIPLRKKASTAVKYVKKDEPTFILKGDAVVVVKEIAKGKTVYGKLDTGDFVILVRDGVPNFE